MPDLIGDIVGRVRRLPLPPSERAALLPLFEAVSNGLQAIEQRHKGHAKRRGKLSIRINRSALNSNEVSGFTITDNGVGLNETHYRAFLTPDSQNKIELGGKGIGRLYWLKVFQHIRVSSNYQSKNRVVHRSFDFSLRNSDQVRNVTSHVPPNGFRDIGTKISLKAYTDHYNGRCPPDIDRIAMQLVSHFLPSLASDTAPKMEVVDGTTTIDLRKFFTQAIRHRATEDIRVPMPQSKHITSAATNQ